MIRALFLSILMALPVPAFAQAALTTLETTPKSLFFAGRCLAPVMLREPVSTKDLREIPTQFATPHLYGRDGTVWHGADDSVVLVVLDEGASCGINVFDEDLEEVRRFMDYWLTREDSPFSEITEETTASGDIRITYEGFCEECGFFMHAQALHLKEAQFTIYRVFATLPEKT